MAFRFGSPGASAFGSTMTGAADSQYRAGSGLEEIQTEVCRAAVLNFKGFDGLSYFRQ